MSFRKVDVNIKYYKYPECKKGQVLVKSGVYKGSREGKFGTLHDFLQDDGQAVTLNKAGQLDWLLENHAPVGTKVNVIFDGTKILEKGLYKGKPVNNFVLEVDDSSFASEHAKIPAASASIGGPDISM